MTGHHVAPVVLIPHRIGPDGWVEAAEDLGRVLTEQPGLPVCIRLPGAAIEHLRLETPEVLSSLVSETVDWLAGGWSDPVLTDLPPKAAQRQIDREATAMNAAGIVPAGLWIGDTWYQELIGFSVENGFNLLFVDAAVIPGPTDRPLVAEKAGTVVTVVGVSDEPAVAASPIDGLAAIGGTVDDLKQTIRYSPLLIRPSDYLSSHRSRTKVKIPSGGPDRAPETDIFYRKVLRLIADQGERKSALDSVLNLQSREFIAGAPPDWESHAKLIEARKTVDRLNYRGDSWVSVVETDWDADGSDEIVVETAHLSMVLDPADGSIPVWDDKSTNWAITAVSPGEPLTFVRRMSEDDVEPPSGPMVVEEIAQGRSEINLLLTDESSLTCRIRLIERSMELELAIPELATAIRIGPEIPLGLNPSSAEIRVDGSGWVAFNGPVGFSGHRFRLRDDSHNVLISAPRPAQFFVRSLPVHGVVAWPHWSTTGLATYQVSISPD